MIDPATALALICELYEQNAALSAEVEDLRNRVVVANDLQQDA